MAGNCDGCGEWTEHGAMVDMSDSSVGYFDEQFLCRECRGLSIVADVCEPLTGGYIRFTPVGAATRVVHPNVIRLSFDKERLPL